MQKTMTDENGVFTVPASADLGAEGGGSQCERDELRTIRGADARQRMATFERLTPTDKACFKRAHAELWLARHRERLTATQIEAMKAAVAFISPDLYARPQDAASRAREAEVKSALECVLAQKDVRDALTFGDAAPEPNLVELADQWLSWFTTCVVRK